MLELIKDIYRNPFKSWFIIALLIINIVGSILGYIWYESQLGATPIKYWLFVPDCPFATTLMSVVLLTFLVNRRSGLFELITYTALIKYGMWTVGVLSLDGLTGGQFTPQTWILFFSHLGMVIQGFFFIRFLKIEFFAVIITSVWMFLNDYMDYVVGVYPYLPNSSHLTIVTVFTVAWTTLISGVLFKKSIKVI